MQTSFIAFAILHNLSHIIITSKVVGFLGFRSFNHATCPLHRTHCAGDDLIIPTWRNTKSYFCSRFIVQDIVLGAERLLSLVTISGKCPIKPLPITRETVLNLFRGLQHPYIYPVLDIEFWESQVALISPLNHGGSLRDLIYACPWHEEYDRKYAGRGEGLPLWQVCTCMRDIHILRICLIL